MSLRSFAKLYLLSESGRTSELFAHISELSRDFPEDPDPPALALIAAAEANQVETIQALLEMGANIEGASQRPHIRPLWKAAKGGHLDAVKLLIAKGADKDAKDNANMTALDYARRYSRKEVVQYLESLQ